MKLTAIAAPPPPPEPTPTPTGTYRRCPLCLFGSGHHDEYKTHLTAHVHNTPMARAFATIIEDGQTR